MREILLTILTISPFILATSVHLYRNRRIPFSIDKYLTGKYNVVTRAGDCVDVMETTPNLLVTIPTRETCRNGHYDYGYLQNGKWEQTGKHELDLFLKRKI